MKTIWAIFLLLACLAYGGSAQAYAIYNDSSYTVCWWGSPCPYNRCKNSSDHLIPPNGTHNGCHDCKANVAVTFKDNNGNCWYAPEAHVPQGGFLRIYNDRVEVWQHCDTCPISDRLHVYGVKKSDCSGNPFI
jgi:hypothetical protein